MKTTRRDIFKFVGGSALGALFTPVPWRLITDTALWSENWPGIPQPVSGEIHTKLTRCSLCPAGCAVRARCVGEQPVSLAGAAAPLCVFGLVGHHLPYHPARLKRGPVDEAAAAVAEALAKCGAEERIAVLDLRPGRTASWTYRRAMAAVPNGVYVAPRQTTVAVNLAAAKTVLSLGAPLFDGWGTPSNVIAAREHFRLIHAEALESQTAVMADVWLPVDPGPLAGEIARALKGESADAETTALARELRDNGPALVVDREMSAEVLELNRLLASFGRTVVAAPETPVPESWKKAAPVTDLSAVTDHSIRVLLIDESVPGGYVPWPQIARKLSADPLVVAFGWSRLGYGRHAQYALPTAVYPEAIDDIPAAIDSVAATFRISVPLVPAPAGVVSPAEFIARLAGLQVGDALRERADAIHKTGQGTIRSSAVRGMKADEFWKALNGGGEWTWDKPPGPPKVMRAAPDVRSDNLPLHIAVCGGGPALASPLMSKVYQESNLRLAPNYVGLHPSDARACGIEDGGRAILQTGDGQVAVRVVAEVGIRPGVVQVAASPEVLDVCGGCSSAKVVPA